MLECHVYYHESFYCQFIPKILNKRFLLSREVYYIAVIKVGIKIIAYFLSHNVNHRCQRWVRTKSHSLLCECEGANGSTVPFLCTFDVFMTHFWIELNIAHNVKGLISCNIATIAAIMPPCVNQASRTCTRHIQYRWRSERNIQWAPIFSNLFTFMRGETIKC